jgi:hypothetical protein
MVVIRLPKNQIAFFELIYSYKQTLSVLESKTALYFSGYEHKNIVLSQLSELKDLIEKMDGVRNYIEIERETEYSATTIPDKIYQLR